MTSISIALVDAHPLMIEAMSSLFARTLDFQLVATGSTAIDVIDICSHWQPHIMVVDLNSPGDAFAAITQAKSIAPSTKYVAFTASMGVESAIRALDAGASGYVLKGSKSDELVEAIRCVASGETYITQSFATRVITALRDTTLRRKAAEAVKLSIREQQIMKLLLVGKTNREIAFAIKISEKTVKHYMTILMQKLHARNRVEVVIAGQKMDYQIPHKSLYS